MLSRRLLTCRVSPSDTAGPARPAWTESPPSPCCSCRLLPFEQKQPAVQLVPHTQDREHQPRVELLKEKRRRRRRRRSWERQVEGQFYDKKKEEEEKEEEEEEEEEEDKKEEEEGESNSPSSSHSSSESSLRLSSCDSPAGEDRTCVLQPRQCSSSSLRSRVVSPPCFRWDIPCTCLSAPSAEFPQQPLSAFSSSTSSALVKLAENGFKDWCGCPCGKKLLNADSFSLSGSAAVSAWSSSSSPSSSSSSSSSSLSVRSSSSPCDSTQAGFWPAVPTSAALSLTTNTVTTPRLSHHHQQQPPCSLVFSLLRWTKATVVVVDSRLNVDEGSGRRKADDPCPDQTSQSPGSQGATCLRERTGGRQGLSCGVCVSSGIGSQFWQPSPTSLPPSPDLQGSAPRLPQTSCSPQGVQLLGDQGLLTFPPQRSASPAPSPSQHLQEALPSPRGDSDTDAQVDSVSSSDLELWEDL